jgi:hypothetical protein
MVAPQGQEAETAGNIFDELHDSAALAILGHILGDPRALAAASVSSKNLRRLCLELVDWVKVGRSKIRSPQASPVQSTPDACRRIGKLHGLQLVQDPMQVFELLLFGVLFGFLVCTLFPGPYQCYPH